MRETTIWNKKEEKDNAREKEVGFDDQSMTSRHFKIAKAFGTRGEQSVASTGAIDQSIIDRMPRR